MLALKILAFILLIGGAFTVFSAGIIVKRFHLDERIMRDNGKYGEDKGITEYDEIEKYRFDRAVLNLKLIGMLGVLPGLIIIILVF